MGGRQGDRHVRYPGPGSDGRRNRLGVRRCAGERAGCCAGHGWRLRLQIRSRRGGSSGHRGGPPDRTPSEVARNAERALPHHRPRPRSAPLLQGRCRRRRAAYWALDRFTGRPRCWSPLPRRWPVHTTHGHRGLPGGDLRLETARRLHQPVRTRHLPGGRAPRGDADHGAHHRPRCHCHWHRPRRGQAAQLHR